MFDTALENVCWHRVGNEKNDLNGSTLWPYAAYTHQGGGRNCDIFAIFYMVGYLCHSLLRTMRPDVAVSSRNDLHGSMMQQYVTWNAIRVGEAKK